MIYDPQKIEKKWQARWREQKTFEISEETDKPKKYILDMFPYPSGDGLHVGHAKIYTGADVLARYWRMKGYAVLHPSGWDAFGLPTENSAIKFGVHPRELTHKNIARFRQQMDSLGWSYDWSREINTTDPTYYKWTQWIFLQLYKRGLAYQATVPINWCPSCLTGLANEEVVEGACERCGTRVELRALRQWLLKITTYAERLLAGLEELKWPKFIVELQKNWIGRKEGINISYPVKGLAEEVVCFTTRPETNFGATFVVLAPEHALAQKIAQEKPEVAAYVKEVLQKTELKRLEEEKKKTGVFTGYVAVNRLTKREMPIWISDFVLGHFGTGAVVGVPAHDERDAAFAAAMGLDSVTVIGEDGKLINSGEFSGLEEEQAREKIKNYLEDQGYGERATTYSLRDWVFSRQRYWGEPIPIIHCKKCGVVPVPEEELPVELPEVEKYQPTGTGESPLADIEEWVKVACPKCAAPARRETNTMPQWAGSSWYWLRFIDPKNDRVLAAPERLKHWLPVDTYIGGAEHAVLHLLYARFWNLVLYDAGVVPQAEPFSELKNVGLVLGEGGVKMSKSRGNVINPDEVVGKYGADALRLYVMFMGPFEGAAEWDTRSMEGVRRFLRRVWSLLEKESGQSQEVLKVKLQQTILRVTESIKQVKFNTGVAALMKFLNEAEAVGGLKQEEGEVLVKLLSPYAPHIAEELWERLGKTSSLTEASWPEVDEQVLAQALVTIPVQVNGKVRGTLELVAGAKQDQLEAQARELSNVAKYLALKKIKKIIFVPDRLINFVVG
jgi:leucyl-tRNA synthetase